MCGKHTPGPWSNDGSIEISAGLKSICGMRFPFKGEENRANARLIAAAPELLSALETFMEMSEEPPEPNCSCHISAPCHDCVDHSGLREAFSLARMVIAKATGDAEAARAEFDANLESEVA